jgi:predicted porin
MKPQTPPFARPSFSRRACGFLDTSHCESSSSPTIRPGKKVFLSVSAGVILALCTGAANAVEAKISGQVNRALMSVNDGTDTELHNVDIHNSSTRIRFAGSAEMMPGVTAGLVFENEFESNRSDKVTQTVKSTAPTWGERHQFVYFAGGFGKLSLGQTDGAANGGTEVDLSGTSIVQGALADNAIGGGILFRNSTIMGPSIGSTTNNQDFESRYDVLRYDTPALGPVKVAVSTGISSSQKVNEVALRFSGGVAGGKLAAALGMSKKDADPNNAATFDQDTSGGSISWLSDSGISVTLSTSKKDVATGPAREGKFSYLKAGYKTGQHAFSVDFGKGKDQAQADDEAKTMGVAWVYKPISWADIFAALEKHSLDRPGTEFDDIQIIVVGSRIKF